MSDRVTFNLPEPNAWQIDAGLLAWRVGAYRDGVDLVTTTTLKSGERVTEERSIAASTARQFGLALIAAAQRAEQAAKALDHLSAVEASAKTLAGAPWFNPTPEDDLEAGRYEDEDGKHWEFRPHSSDGKWWDLNADERGGFWDIPRDPDYNPVAVRWAGARDE